MAENAEPHLTALADTAPFDSLGGSTLRALSDAAVVERWAPGDRLCVDESGPRALFVVTAGAVALHDAEGVEYTRAGAGTLIGVDRYLEQEPRYVVAQALEPVTVLRLPFTTLQALEHDHPSLSALFNQIIALRIRDRGLARARPHGILAEPVHRIMNAPLACCPETHTLREVYDTMRRRKIGSFGVTGRDHGQLLGIVTLNSLAKAVLVDGHAPDDPVRRACEEAHTVHPKTPLWQAEALQKSRGMKYLVIQDGGRPLGMVSQTNILNALLAQQDILLDWVAAAEDLDSLAAKCVDVPDVARDLWQRNRDAARAALALSDFHLAIQRRCIELTLAAMRDEGLGDAPRRFAFIIMGSGGRREMLLNPDQDNAIIIDDDGGGRPLGEEEDEWFRMLTDRVNVNLDRVGYRLCPGDIMARNPDYRRTLSGWCQRIDHHVRYPNETAARWANIFFDFSLLYGDARLSSALWDHVVRAIAKRGRLLRFMADDNAQGRPAIGLFNRLVTADDAERRGRVDIKRNGLRLICDAARIFALYAGITETNTGERLHGLVRQGELEADFADSVLAAHEELTDLLLAHQLGQSAQGEEPDKLVHPEALDPLGRETLRMAMYAVKRFQDRLQGRFGL